MIISPINLYNNFNLYAPIKSQPAFKALSLDTFEKRAANKKQNVPFGVDKSLIKGLHPFLKTEVSKYPYDIVRAAKDTAQMTKITKKALDGKYGKDNWVFVSIGTSPALIGKGLELLGEDVRYVPISGIRYTRMGHKNKDMIREKMGQSYIEYLNSIGLSKEKIAKDKRKYIICDFTSLGTSLNNAEDVAKNVLNIDEDKIAAVSINDLLSDYSNAHCSSKTQKCVADYINNYFVHQEAEDYGNIPHIDYKELKSFNLEEAVKKGANLDAEAFERALRYYL